MTTIRWKAVEIPKPWRPKQGEELFGVYGGRTVRNGPHGQYEVILVHARKRVTYVVSGTDIIQRIDAAHLSEGDPLRIIYLGTEEVGVEGWKKKRFQLLVVDDAAGEEWDERAIERELAAIAEGS
jgi:hypothetical protein